MFCHARLEKIILKIDVYLENSEISSFCGLLEKPVPDQLEEQSMFSLKDKQASPKVPITFYSSRFRRTNNFWTSSKNHKNSIAL